MLTVPLCSQHWEPHHWQSVAARQHLGLSSSTKRCGSSNWSPYSHSQMVSIYLQCRRPGFDPWVGKIPWRRKWHPTLVLLPGKSHGRRSLIGYSPCGHKESDRTEQLHFHSHLHGPKEMIPDTKGWPQANEPELRSTRSWRLFPEMRWEPRCEPENLVQSSLFSQEVLACFSVCGSEKAAHWAFVNNLHKRFSFSFYTETYKN